MIGKKEFEDILKIYKEYDAILNKFEELIPSIFESPIVDKFWKCHKMLLEAYFTESGCNYIIDYLCDSSIEVDNKIIDNVDKLWDFIKEYKKWCYMV